MGIGMYPVGDSIPSFVLNAFCFPPQEMVVLYV